MSILNSRTGIQITINVKKHSIGSMYRFRDSAEAARTTTSTKDGDSNERLWSQL